MTGVGHAWCHHGEILQGVFPDHDGTPRPGLVTLPVTDLLTRAEFTPGPTGAPLSVSPRDRTKALRAARIAVHVCARDLGFRPCGGHLRLSAGIPVGLGMGSSTSDVIAAVRAVAAGFGTRLPAATVARLAVRAESASDPLMLHEAPVLFAHRHGRVLEVLGAALPPAVVVGCLLGGGAAVDTLSLDVPSCSDDDLTRFECLRERLRRAVRTVDTGLMGRVCTDSARLNQRRHPQPELSVLEGIAERSGAAGVQVAHSGNVAGLLFDPAVTGLNRRLRHCARALDAAGIPVTRTFRITDGRSRRQTCTTTSRTRSAGRHWSASTTDSCASASRA